MPAAVDQEYPVPVVAEFQGLEARAVPVGWAALADTLRHRLL